ncbi:MAG: hypothetical protein MJ234_01230 [bacterium]|nr:hypothetical protein [bacterium]
MDSINALNHFSYIAPQRGAAASHAAKTEAPSQPAASSDGFERGASMDSVMSQTDALKFLSSSEKAHGISDPAVRQSSSGFGFELNGISSASFFYLGI